MNILALRLLFAALLATTAAPLQAAEPEIPAAETADAAAETTTDAAPVASDDSSAEDETPGTLAADDTFVPTVEISEDLSVSFPADI